MQQASQKPINQYNKKNTNNDSTLHCTRETQKTTVVSQTSPPKGMPTHAHFIATGQSPGNQTGSGQVPFLNCSRKCPIDSQELEQHTATTLTGDTTIPLLAITTPLIEEGLVRAEQTNEVYLPLTHMVVMKRKQEMLSLPPHFENNLKVDAVVDSESGAYVSAIAQNYLDAIKHEAPKKFSKSPILPILKKE